MQARKAEPNIEAKDATNPDGSVSVAPDVAQPKKSRTWLLIPAVVLLVLAIFEGARFLSYSRSHVTTDNAFLTADITLVSPQVSGTIEDITVKDNQAVKAGQLLAVLDDSTYRVNVLQAQANLTAAIAAQQAAAADLALSQKTSSGLLTQANGGVEQAQGGVLQAQSTLANADAAVTAARAEQGNYSAQEQASEAAVQTAQQNRTRAIEAVTTAKAQVTAARSAVDGAQASLKSAQAHAVFAKNQVARFQSLLAQGAVSKEQEESAEQDWDTADAAVQAAQAGVSTAQANLSEREGELASAQQGVPLANSAITQARAGASAASHQSQVAAAMVQQAIANRSNMAEGISTAKGKVTQASGQQQSANTVPQVIATKQAAAQQAAAKVEQAKAALEQARLDLAHTKIYAPVDGFVGNRTIDKGTMVQPGLPLMSVVKGDSLYVLANLKETQTANLLVGQEAEIDVDGLPAHSFKGHVVSLSPATGATFALLPPDNASGNFVKVVQRVPVRIGLDSGQPDLDRLRAGLSASVSIKLK